jgi:hypothetical protein
MKISCIYVQIRAFAITKDNSVHQPIPSGVAVVHKASSDPLKATYLRAPSEACDALLMLRGLPDRIVLAIPRVLCRTEYAMPHFLQPSPVNSQPLSCHVFRGRQSEERRACNSQTEKEQTSSLCGVTIGSMWCASAVCCEVSTGSIHAIAIGQCCDGRLSFAYSAAAFHVPLHEGNSYKAYSSHFCLSGVFTAD